MYSKLIVKLAGIESAVGSAGPVGTDILAKGLLEVYEDAHRVPIGTAVIPDFKVSYNAKKDIGMLGAGLGTYLILNHLLKARAAKAHVKALPILAGLTALGAGVPLYLKGLKDELNALTPEKAK